MGDDLTKMFEWFNKSGQSVNVAELKRENPEVGWHSFRDWARNYNWSNALTA
jgi:hypothetical protein